jgi:hypothetical protein
LLNFFFEIDLYVVTIEIQLSLFRKENGSFHKHLNLVTELHLLSRKKLKKKKIRVTKIRLFRLEVILRSTDVQIIQWSRVEFRIIIIISLDLDFCYGGVW